MVKNKHIFHERRVAADRRKSEQAQEMFYDGVNSSNSTQGQQNTQVDIRLGSLVINRSQKAIAINDIPVSLSHKEYEIIECLATNPGCVVETQDILKKVWSECGRATKADVHQYMHLLRKKIEVDPKNPKLLITVKGFGYELRP